jgi:hypothetical protein
VALKKTERRGRERWNVVSRRIEEKEEVEVWWSD